MKIISFDVQANIPEKLKPLNELANNLFFSWHFNVIEAFRRIDRQQWEKIYHNPVKLLNSVSQNKLNSIAADQSFLSYTRDIYERFKAYFEEDTWFLNTFPNLHKETHSIAYFSMEFGLDECLPIYSGGLGILAGDHLKAASDLGIPLVGVGMAYSKGYFNQYLNADGWQQEAYPEIDLSNLPITLERNSKGEPLYIDVQIGKETIYAQIWRCNVGRIPLYLLDANIQKNSEENRLITATLYGGDTLLRIKQEILLGIGGVRALAAMDKSPCVFHMNEGHAAFLSLERMNRLINDHHLSYQEARELVKCTNVFTTHTPVPAGNDRFEPHLLYDLLSYTLSSFGMSKEEFLSLGRENVTNNQELFCMTVLALKMATFCNGVSALHGHVSRTMWQAIWPQLPTEEVPIRHITNGVHLKTWISHDLSDLFDLYMGPKWGRNPQDPANWELIDTIPDIELWGTHERRRERLVAFARHHLQEQLRKRGAPQIEIERAGSVLNPKVLTIGFAKRFATYKRATLIFRDIERIKKLLLNDKHPVQLIFAGKAHPLDNPGKNFIQQIVKLAKQEEFRNKIVFIENYDMNVARYLVQGCDIWLNNPRRPLEASGTSGMKAAANGVINLSVLDGWWVEGYTNETGWSIGRGEEYQDHEAQDAVESNALYYRLEDEVIPLFYKREMDNVPREWVARMKTCIKTICPVFNTSRMVSEYSTKFYMPALTYCRALTANSFAPLKQYSKWKTKLRADWFAIRIKNTKSDNKGTLNVGDQLTVKADIELGNLSPEDVKVQIYYGALNSNDQIDVPMVQEMDLVATKAGISQYKIVITCDVSGRYGYTLRLLPNTPYMAHTFESNLLSWLE